MGCDGTAQWRFAWPGKDEAGICAAHEPKLRRVAAALGFHLQLVPIERLCGACHQVRTFVEDGECVDCRH